jgi:regulator of protease activity HflC (stomatin/prohibitin superfamily)
MKSKLIGAIIAGVLVVGGLVGTIMCIEKIPAGYVGVVYSMNDGVQDETLSQGWHIVSPTKKVVEYTVSTEQGFLRLEDESNFSVPTSDGKMIDVDVEYSYHFNTEKLPDTYTRFKGQSGEAVENSFIKGKIKSWSQEVTATFPVLDIYSSKRGELNTALYSHLLNKFDEYGIVIDSINFSRIGLDEQTAQTIQDIVTAQQELERVKIEKDKAQLESERAKIEAQGKAEVTRINAEAESKANELKQQSLTDNIVKYEAIKKWDGKLPTVSGGASTIIDMKDLTGGNQ